MEEFKRHCALSLLAICYIALFIAGLHMVSIAWGHEEGEMGMSKEVAKFLKTWKRPKGDFSIEHRMQGCCYVAGALQDCFPVAETKYENGRLLVRPEVGTLEGYNHWYDVTAHHIDEAEQADPRESPDGRSYVCIVGNDAVCYVGGAGT